MKNWITIFYLLLTLTTFSQSRFNESKISKETTQIITDIAKINMLMSSAVGEAGVRPKQYDNFIKLYKKASTDELKELTNHSNPTVRCYSFWALSYDHSIELYPIVIDHINDDELVNTQFGCIISSKPVGDFFINLVTPNYVDLNSKKISRSKFASLDSILVYTPNNLSASSKALLRVNPTEVIYPRIRELVTEKNNQTALVTLAKYQKNIDVELIVNNRTESKFEEGGYFYTYKAISQFPHINFLPLLEENLQKTLDNTHFSNEWKELYKAIASYKNKEAVELLQIPFTEVKDSSIRKYHIDFVYRALRKFKDPVFENLMWRLWEEENRITTDIFQYLKGINSERTYKLTKETLYNSDAFYGANISFDFDDVRASETLTSKMLDLVIMQNKVDGLEIIKRNIEETNVHLFPIFANKVIQMKDISFIEPLFIRLERESNPHIYLKITEALITYQSDDINQRIIKTRRNNKKLRKDWGGKALDELLEKNNIN